MYKGSGPRIFPIIVAIVVIAIVIAALFSIARMIFFSGDAAEPAADTTQQTVSLRDEVLKTAEARSVRYTVRGPIVADENFRSYQITVSPSGRSMVVYKGYLEEIIESKSFGNSTRAYEEFVHALDKAEISSTREAKNQDIRGVCATRGKAYTFEVIDSGRTKSSLWTSTCGGSKGTMAADISRIHALFANQIPDFKPVFDRIQ